MVTDLIKRHEGLRLKAYLDTKGKLTVGYGMNLDAAASKAICGQLKLNYISIRNGQPITEANAEAILALQLRQVNSQARAIFSKFHTFPDNAQAVIQDLLFNMGMAGFLQFHDTIEAMQVQDWQAAADHLVDSLWFKQTKTRAVDDVSLLRSI
jgi:lysozyme